MPAPTPPRGGNAKHRNLGPRPLLAVLLWLIVLRPDRFPSTVEPLCQSLGLFGLVDELLVAVEARAREVGAANPRKRLARSPEQYELDMEQAGTVVNQPDVAKVRQSLECVRSGVVSRDSGQCAHLSPFPPPLLQTFECVQSNAFRCPSRGDVHSPHRPAFQKRLQLLPKIACQHTHGRSQFQIDRQAYLIRPAVVAIPSPWRSSTVCPALKSPNSSVSPSGQRTVTSVAPSAAPRPKWARGSLDER